MNALKVVNRELPCEYAWLVLQTRQGHHDGEMQSSEQASLQMQLLTMSIPAMLDCPNMAS